MNRREFIKDSAAAIAAFELASRMESHAESSVPNWYRDVTRKIHFDMHTPASVENVGRDFDPQAFARALKETGVEAVSYFSRCTYGWSYYPTKVGLPHPHLTRDVFGDGVKALKDQGLRVIAYYAIDSLPVPLAERHREWCRYGPDGVSRMDVDSRYLACPMGSFPEQMLIAQFREIASTYPVDGFFLDGVYSFFMYPCYCERCRQALGHPIPQKPDDPTWRAFRHFQVQRIWDIFGRAASEVARVRPGCLMGVNWMASTWYSVPPPASIGYLTGDPPVENLEFETAYQLAAWAWREKPADLMNQRMLHSWTDFTCRTPENIETEFATALAAGGKLFVGDLLRPVNVRPDPEIMRLFRTCFDFSSQREALTKGTHGVSDIAILSSPETLRRRGSEWTTDENPLKGAYLALVEDGLTADILFDADLDNRLSKYQALVIPEQAFIGRKAADAIRKFVDGGGGLVVTGCLPQAVDPEEPSSAADRGGFQAITGLTAEGEHDLDVAYLELRGTKAEDFWRDHDNFRPPIPVWGKPAKVLPSTAEVLATLTAPGITYQSGARPPGEKLDSPALTAHRYGQGKVLFCALGIAAEVWKRGNPGAKYVLQKMVRRVALNLMVQRIGPPSVQLYCSEDEKRTIVHLIAYQPDRRVGHPQIVESPASIANVQIKLREARVPKRVRVEPGGMPVEYRHDGQQLSVVAPPFGIHTAIVFDWN
jgi:hypothetical protein